MLPQHSDIEIAWYASIQQEPNGWKTVTTQFYIQEFSEYIAPLQDAVDLEIATEEERSLLEAWNKYRVLLNQLHLILSGRLHLQSNQRRRDDILCLKCLPDHSDSRGGVLGLYAISFS